jgi:hypothetical protein
MNSASTALLSVDESPGGGVVWCAVLDIHHDLRVGCSWHMDEGLCDHAASAVSLVSK